MKFSEAVAEVDSAIMQAGALFVTQVRLVLPLESLAVVLLDPERDTSRVVFSWGSPHQSGSRKGASVSASPRASAVAQPSSCLSLNGCQGPVGAVLIRSQVANGHPFDVQELLQAPAGQLALVLENIQLQQRLERRKAETLALERIAKIASSDATPGRIYRQFAGEIKQLMDYHRLSFYLADAEADLLTCVYRQGLGVRRHQPLEAYRLSGNACELAIAEGQSYIVEDAPYSGAAVCAQRLRSALVAPIYFEGKVIGTIVPQNTLPNAYSPLEQRLLERAARLLGPRIANTELYARLGAKAQELSLARALPDLIGSLEESPDALGRLGDALGKVTDFDLLVIRLKCGDERWTMWSLPPCRPTENPDAALSQFLETLPGNQQWLGNQPGEARSVLVPDLQAASGESFQEELLGFGFKSCLHVFLRSRSASFGVLSLYSRQPSGFDVSTRRTLEGLASHMAPVVQHAHLYQEAQEQARHNQALSSIARELAATSDVGAALNSACETMAGLLDASYLHVLVQEDGQTTQKAGWRREQAGEGDWGELVLSLERDTGTLGRMVVGRSPERGRLSAAQVQLAEAFADQLAAALEQFRLDDERRRQTQELAFLDDMARVLASPRPLEEVFRHLAGAFSQLISFDSATLSWLDPNGYDIDTIGWRRGLAPLETLSPEEQPAFSIQTNLRFRNQGIGTLTLSRDKEGAFAARERETLERLGIQIAPVIQNIRLYHQARRQAYQLRQLNRTQQSGIGYAEYESPAQGILDAMVGHGEAAWATIYLYKEDDLALVRAAVTSPFSGVSAESVADELSGVVESCFSTGQPQVLLWAPGTKVSAAGSLDQTEDCCSYLALPLLGQMGTIGVLVLARQGAGGWGSSELEDSLAVAADTAVRLEGPGLKQEGDRYNSLQPADSMGRELLVDVAHALRNPLAAIKGYCSALLQSDVTWPPELQREFLETIDEETDVLDVVIGELLAPTDGEDGVVRLDRVESTAQFLFDQAGRVMAEKSQSIPVEFRCSGDVPLLLVDPGRIVQVISHLARCASQTAGPGARVMIGCSCQEGEPEIVIGTGDLQVDGDADSQLTGADKTQPAASPELRLPELRLPESRLEEDLRVTICQSLLEAHGVRLEIGPWKGRSGLFRFLLPLAPARDPWVLAGA